MTQKEAEKLSLLYLKIGSDLDASVTFWRDHSDEPRFHEARGATGRVMGALYADLMAPLWKEFPDLLPSKMGGCYDVADSCYQPRFYEPMPEENAARRPYETNETD